MRRVVRVGGRVAPQTLRLRGRDLHVPRAAVGAEVARFSFDQLCGAALGAEDYLGVASAYHTVFVDGVPVIRTHVWRHRPLPKAAGAESRIRYTSFWKSRQMVWPHCLRPVRGSRET